MARGGAAQETAGDDGEGGGGGAGVAAERRTRRVFLGVVAVYALGIGVLAAFGLFGFIWKTVVVPALFIAAALLGRLRVFVRDWAVLLGAIILFDSMRGLIFALINRFELPVYMVYAIDWERALLGGETLPEKLQRVILEPGEIGLFAKLLVMVHTSHFVFFLFFGLLIWLVRAAEFGRFKLALVLLMYSGLVGYLAVPTVPPWMAAAFFEALPPIRHVTSQIYNLSIPSLQASFDTNPIAAMPSLHSAFPSLLAMISLHHFGRRGWPVPLYAGLVFLAVTGLGEHYLVDVLAGVALAGACYWAAYHSALPRLVGVAPPAGPRSGGDLPVFRDPIMRRRVLIMALLLIFAEASGLWSRKYQWRYEPTMAFVERELDGRSPQANFHRGRRAFRQGDFAAAQAAMEKAVIEVTRMGDEQVAHLVLGRSAFHNQDWPAAVVSLGRFPLPALGPPTALMLAKSQLQAGLRDEGFRTLDELARIFPGDAGVGYWKDQLEAEHARPGEEETPDPGAPGP